MVIRKIPNLVFAGIGTRMGRRKTAKNLGQLDVCSCSVLNGAMSAREDLPFTVELWSENFERLEETVARAADFLTAKAAYDALVKRWPGEPIMVRQGARVVLKGF
jgi:hypothetical protein